MGQAESQVEESQVPGFNPGVPPRKVPQGKGARPAARGDGGIQPKIQQDVFFKHVDVKDHIRPIFERDRDRVKEELEEDFGVVDVTRLLEDDDGRRRNESDDGELKDFPNIDGDEDGSSSSSEDEDEDRGIFHHEVKKQQDEGASVFSSEAHPVNIRGDACVASTLHFEDASEWRHNFPVHSVEWLMSTEIGNQINFQQVARGDDLNFLVPPEAVGRYIQVVALRRVEDQLKGTYGAEEGSGGGVYDPHVLKARHLEKGIERKFVDVRSYAVVGPVLISDSWAYAVLKALSEGHFDCAVKLRDEVKSGDGAGVDDSVSRHGSSLKIMGTISINFEHVEFSYTLPNGGPRVIGDSTLLSLAWLTHLLGWEAVKRTTTNSVVDALKGQQVVSLNIKDVAFRPTTSKRTMMLIIQPRKKSVHHKTVTQDIVRFDADPTIGRDALLYILLGFQAAVKFRQKRAGAWKEFFNQGDVDKGKHLIQRFLEFVTVISKEDAPAYEEVALDPWEY